MDADEIRTLLGEMVFERAQKYRRRILQSSCTTNEDGVRHVSALVQGNGADCFYTQVWLRENGSFEMCIRDRCGRSAASSAPTPVPVPLVWPSLIRDWNCKHPETRDRLPRKEACLFFIPISSQSRWCRLQKRLLTAYMATHRPTASTR